MTDPVPAPLDHLVYGGPDLAEAVAAVEELTGVRAARGGRHVTQGTANHLIALGRARYLEVVGPDREQERPAGPLWFDLDRLTGPRLLTWAVRTTDIDAAVALAHDRGVETGPARAMSRRTDDGSELSWRLTPDTVAATGGVVPFLIDWGTTPHPTTRELPRLALVSFRVGDPQPEALAASLAALDAAARVAEGPRGLTAVLSGPRGEVELR